MVAFDGHQIAEIVVGIGRITILHIQRPPAEAATLRDDNAVRGLPFGSRYARRYLAGGVLHVQNGVVKVLGLQALKRRFRSRALPRFRLNVPEPLYRNGDEGTMGEAFRAEVPVMGKVHPEQTEGAV